MGKAKKVLLLGVVTLATVDVAVTSVHAAPLVTNVGFFTERLAPNTVPGFSTATVRNSTQWTVTVISSDQPSAVSVVASHPNFSSFNLLYNGSPIFQNYLFVRNSVPFSEAGLLTFAGNTTPWSFAATDSTGSASGQFPLITSPALMPFATNVIASDSSLSPTISWVLPDLTGIDYDQLQLRAIDASTGSQIFRTILPSLTDTSFRIPFGVLQSGHSYYYRVMIADLDNGQTSNRSNAFSSVATRAVPEPGTLGLLGLGLAGLAAARRRKQ